MIGNPHFTRTCVPTENETHRNHGNDITLPIVFVETWACILTLFHPTAGITRKILQGRAARRNVAAVLRVVCAPCELSWSNAHPAFQQRVVHRNLVQSLDQCIDRNHQHVPPAPRAAHRAWVRARRHPRTYEYTIDEKCVTVHKDDGKGNKRMNPGHRMASRGTPA